ncbi:MAG: ComEC/Rec2 family competence protein [Clostridium sp.]|uniref:ComEC/Rec2 family competence protein n=1 Tax=Clostridium sp. TaxID=1506 RepID=UPI0030542B62
MYKKFISKFVAITLLMTMFFTNVNTNNVDAVSVDQLYAAAQEAAVKAQKYGTQESITAARTAIVPLLNAYNNGEIWLESMIGTLSGMVDGAQQQLFNKFYDILFANGGLKETLTQVEIDQARGYVDGFKTYTGNTEYITSWSSAVDNFQQAKFDVAFAAVEKAILSKLQADVDLAQILLTEIATSKVESVKAWANTVQAQLDKVTGNLKVSYIDVGQADAILIQQGDKYMMIDAGNNDDGIMVVDYLKKQGITKLEYVLGTHPHEDHIGGLDNVINNFEIGKVMMPSVETDTQTYKDVVNAAKNKGLKIENPKVGDVYSLGDATFTILAPIGTGYIDLNDYSIVTKLKYGNNSFIFTGDMETLSEGQLLAKQLDLSADVLKVAHHGSGSSTSQAFLDKVNPKYAVISVGKDNNYGHPDATVLNRLSSKGVNLFRTDKQGTIIATSNGNNITFNTQPTVPEIPSVDENMSVWIASKTGTVYHDSKECSSMKTPIEIILKEARARGLKPCSKCNPPL